MSRLLDLLACPVCRGPLIVEPQGLRCATCDETYALDDDVATLLPPGSTRSGSRTSRLHYAILRSPRLYDFHQVLGGGRTIAAHVGSALSAKNGETVLDIGAGTGMVAQLLPKEAQYVWFDNDESKLQGFLSKSLGGLAVLGDAQRLPFRDDAAEWSVMVEVSHHLPEGVMHDCFEEAARVTRDHFLFVDGLRGDRLRSRALWQVDLGRFPRTESELLDALGAHFEIQSVGHFRINHDHLLCLCGPKQAAA